MEDLPLGLIGLPAPRLVNLVATKHGPEPAPLQHQLMVEVIVLEPTVKAMLVTHNYVQVPLSTSIYQ